MNPGFFFITVGIAVLLLWTTILPMIDRAIAGRKSTSLRHTPGWHNFQQANTKQAKIFGGFLVALGLLNLMIR